MINRRSIGILLRPRNLDRGRSFPQLGQTKTRSLVRSGDIPERWRRRGCPHPYESGDILELAFGSHSVSVDGVPVKKWAMSNPPPGYPRVSPYLLYEDATAAVEYLQRCFGFELRRSETGGAGRAHNELLLGEDGLVMLGQAGGEFSSPRTLGAFPPAMIHAYVDDVDTLHSRATDAGAEVSDLEVSPAGDRRFTATDPEGQMWVFAQRLAKPDK